jgi:indole-3-glycerol phosphate synthase
MTFMDDVVREKRSAVKRKQRSLIKAVSPSGVSFIAEIKRASPSEGFLRDVDAVEIVRLYESAGVSAVSVLTDSRYFGGSLDDLRTVKDVVNLPVLRKDFIVDEMQLHEALIYGADAVLLIASLLKGETADYVSRAHDLGLECLVEVHGEGELDYALESGARLIGINNRDLTTLKVDLGTTERIAPLIPEDRLIVAESGIKTREDVKRMEGAGADAVLVGSALMKSDNIPEKLLEMMG